MGWDCCASSSESERSAADKSGTMAGWGEHGDRGQRGRVQVCSLRERPVAWGLMARFAEVAPAD